MIVEKKNASFNNITFVLVFIHYIQQMQMLHICNKLKQNENENENMYARDIIDA